VSPQAKRWFSLRSLLGFARVSTAEQDAALQVNDLTAAGCYGVYTDHARLAGR
jgi:hypothetical protein